VEDEVDEISNQEFEQFEKSFEKDKWHAVNCFMPTDVNLI